MKTHTLIQGSNEWHAYRAQHWNASDAPAMMGQSPYKTRTELLHERHTGMSPDVDANTQALFDDGHRFEALARPIAEGIIGDDLYPVTGSMGKYSASFDGLTMDQKINFEHKSLNAALRLAMFEGCTGADLPLAYRIQMEQQHMVSGAERTLFVASRWNGNDLVEELHCWYEPDAELRAAIIQGWDQFEADLATYVPVEVVEGPIIVSRSPDQLPVLHSAVKGSLVLESNIKEWEEAATAYIKTVREHELKTDEDFANADAAVKWCETSKLTLQGVKASLMSATGDVNVAAGTLDRIMAELDKTRIAFTNASKARKDACKIEIVSNGTGEFAKHIASLNARLGRNFMPVIQANFPGVIRGLKSLDSMRDKVATELARAKIEANAIADKIDANLRHLSEMNAPMFLFADLQSVSLKSPDDFVMLVKSRIADHAAAEAAKEEATRARIQAEEQAKAERNARELVAREQAAEAKRLTEIAAFEKLEADEIARLARINTQVVVEAPAPVIAPASTVLPFIAPARPVAPATPPNLKLGDINARLAPIQLSAAALSQLGFEPAARVGASQMFHERDFPFMCAAVIKHVQQVQAKQAA